MSDLTMDLSAVRKKGGKYFAYKRVTSLGADKSPADTWHDGSYRRSHKLGFETPFESDELEDGVETYEDGKTTSMFELILAQDDPAVFNFINDECGAGKYFAIFLDRGKTAGGAPYRVFIPIVEIEKSGVSETGTRSITLKCKMTAPISAVTPATKPTWVNTVAASWTCAIGAFFKPLADPAT